MGDATDIAQPGRGLHESLDPNRDPRANQGGDQRTSTAASSRALPPSTASIARQMRAAASLPSSARSRAHATWRHWPARRRVQVAAPRRCRTLMPRRCRLRQRHLAHDAADRFVDAGTRHRTPVEQRQPRNRARTGREAACIDVAAKAALRSVMPIEAVSQFALTFICCLTSPSTGCRSDTNAAIHESATPTSPGANRKRCSDQWLGCGHGFVSANASPARMS